MNLALIKERLSTALAARGYLRDEELDIIHLVEALEVKEASSINTLVAAAHANAVSKGWWEEDRSFAEIAMLIVTEVAEAVEDFRNGKQPTEVWYERAAPGSLYTVPKARYATDKPCGIPSELADIVIRVFDYCGHVGIDLEEVIREKMAFNATRPIRHGGKVL